MAGVLIALICIGVLASMLLHGNDKHERRNRHG
jgi:hypothetical protein